jgi:hypothetical protein
MNDLARAQLPKIGLAQNPSGTAFRCGECEFFKQGVCRNPHPQLKGRPVDAETMCCDLYRHPGMRVIVS